MVEKNTARILIADDHRIGAEGLRALLQPHFEIIGIATDGRALVGAARQHLPDVVISEISIPLLNGIEAVRHLKESQTGLKFVVLTIHADISYVTQAIRAGAGAYVLKSCAAADLIYATRSVLKGRTYLSPAIRELMGARTAGSERHEPGHLTLRQREVLQLIAEGRSSKEIASALDISVKTVEFHRSNIMDALGIHTVAELTRYALHEGIVKA